MSMMNQPVPSAPSSEYEFSPGQDRIISDLARKMHLVGVVLFIVGIFGIVAGLLGRVEGGSLIQGLLNLLMGHFSMKGAKAFDNVVQSKGRDITFLMEGMQSLSRVYGVVYWIIVIVLIFIAVWVVLLLLTLAGVGVAGLFMR